MRRCCCEIFWEIRDDLTVMSCTSEPARNAWAGLVCPLGVERGPIFGLPLAPKKKGKLKIKRGAGAMRLPPPKAPAVGGRGAARPIKGKNSNDNGKMTQNKLGEDKLGELLRASGRFERAASGPSARHFHTPRPRARDWRLIERLPWIPSTTIRDSFLVSSLTFGALLPGPLGSPGWGEGVGSCQGFCCSLGAAPTVPTLV